MSNSEYPDLEAIRVGKCLPALADGFDPVGLLPLQQFNEFASVS